jgi:hypothetical protein
VFLDGELVEEVERHGVQATLGKMRLRAALQDATAAYLLDRSESHVDKYKRQPGGLAS